MNEIANLLRILTKTWRGGCNLLKGTHLATLKMARAFFVIFLFNHSLGLVVIGEECFHFFLMLALGDFCVYKKLKP